MTRHPQDERPAPADEWKGDPAPATSQYLNRRIRTYEEYMRDVGEERSI